LVMPSVGGKTWFGSAESGTPAALVARTQKVMSGVGGVPISSRQGLDILTHGAPAIGAYFPLDGIGQALAWASQGVASASFPDGGRSGVAVVIGATKKGTVVTATFGMSIPRDAFAITPALDAWLETVLSPLRF
ncbi:MAG: hypothetical protein ACHREM_27230, partial [Polyangiales bacterium]